MPFVQTATSDVDFEDFVAYCREIGCKISGSEITFETDEQIDLIQSWLTENGFTGKTN